MSTFYGLAAQAVLLVHFAWIVFVVTGAFFLRRRARLRLIHLASVIYSVGIEVFGWICPLTHLEQALWRRAGREVYQGAFISHYLEKIIYLRAPQWLLVSLVVLVLAVTLAIYFWPTRQTGPDESSRSG
jgi:hypothetical protein